MSRTVGSSARGSEANGTTAAAPGCRITSSSPVEPSGKRTVSTSRFMTRPVWIRFLSSFIIPPVRGSALEQPREGHLESFGEQIPGVAPHVGMDGRACRRRRVRRQPQASRNDLQSQHVKAVADQQHAAAVSPVEPALYLIDRREGVMTTDEGKDCVVGDAEPDEIVAPDVSFVECVADTDAAGDQDGRRQTALVECGGVIESSAKDG